MTRLGRAQWAVLVVLAILCVAGASGLIVEISGHGDHDDLVVEESRERLWKLTRAAAADIEGVLLKAVASADAFAAEIEAGLISDSDLLERLEATVEGDRDFYGAAVAFAPHAHDPDRRLYAPYYCRKHGADQPLAFVELDGDYDYTEGYDWYTTPMSGGDGWSEPYFGPSGKTLMVTYSAVFHAADGSPRGVVTIDISMDRLRLHIESLDLGSSGFGALVTGAGEYLYHPRSEYVRDRRTLTSVAAEKNDADRIEMARLAASKSEGLIEHTSTTTGQESWLIVVPVPLSGWSLQNTFIKDDLPVDVDAQRQALIRATAGFCLLLIGLAGLLLRVHLGTAWRMYTLSVLVTLAFVTGIALVWKLQLTLNTGSRGRGTHVTELGTVDALVAEHARRAAANGHPPCIVAKTGLYIEAIQFASTTDVQASGTLWVTFPSDVDPADVGQPQIAHDKNTSWREVARTTHDGQVTVRWEFETQLRQELEHSKYPLDVSRVEMMIVPEAGNSRVALVPDLASYPLRGRSMKPGLDPEVFLRGWRIQGTGFEFRRRRLTTDFGLARSVTDEPFPGLVYAVGIRRNFIDAFISYLTPQLVVSLILFAMLLISPKLDFSKALSLCVGMFFVIVFSHIDVRGKISSSELFYLEYFYFAIYASNLWVAVNALRQPLDVPLTVTTHKLAVASYWPVLIGSLFAVTALVFY